MSLVDNAKRVAIEAHGDQKYGKKPYSYHLERVYAILAQYTDDENLLAAAWLHDTLEDTELTQHDIEWDFGKTIGNYVWACTGTGRTRKDKQESILIKIAAHQKAAYVKVADRIANIQENIDTKNEEMFWKYHRESAAFIGALADYISDELLVHYINVLESGERLFLQ